MKKVSKGRKPNELADYIYIRLGKEAKDRLKEVAISSGSNMTIWVRQLIMREIAKDKYETRT